MMRGRPLLPLCLALAGCEPPEAPAPPQVLATSAHFTVGDLALAVPVVGVSQVSAPGPHYNSAFSPRDEDDGPRDAVRLAERAANPGDPVPAGMLSVTADRYQIGPGRCGMFDRTWSRRLCTGRTGHLKDLPDLVMLVERRNLSQFEAHYTVGSEKRSDQIAAMGRVGRTPELACDKRSKFCTAALAVSPRVLAVWTVWSGSASEERAEQMAARQAPAILGWVLGELVGGKPRPGGR
jgi:hypothetical protein